MTANFSDILKGTTIRWGTLESIPHVQGFYLLFDAKREFVYVGQGFGDDRVKAHFDRNRKDDYIEDACYWLWFPRFDENEALAYEKAVYDVHYQITGQPPKHNKISPPGIPPSSAILRMESIKEQCARADWIDFLIAVIENATRQNEDCLTNWG